MQVIPPLGAMGECDGKAKTSIWGLAEGCGKKFVDCRVVIFIGADPEPVRFDAAGDQIDVRIREILDLFTEFRCVSSAGIGGVEDRTVALLDLERFLLLQQH